MAKKFQLHDQSLNDKKFIVLTAGIRLERFKKNPAMLNDHNPKELLGKWVNLQVDGDKIYAEPNFNKKKPLAAEKAQEVEDGFLNGASLGLNPIRFANGSEFGFGEDVLVLAESELIEASIVSIPSNENSVQLYGNDGNPLAAEELNKIRLSHGGGSPEKSKQNRNMDFKSLVIAALGLKADAPDGEVASAMQTAFNEAKTLKAENATLKLAAETAEANELENMVQGAVDAGKIPAEAKAGYLTLGKGNTVIVKSILDAIKPTVAAPVNLAAQLTAAAANGAAMVDANDQTKWKLKDWMEKDYDGLIALKASNKAAYIKLYNEAGVPVSA